jgi:DNA-binding transcriptional ArsR family regulator
MTNKVLEHGPLERLYTGNATAKILDFLVAMQEFDYSESDIARYSGVSIRHAQREIPKLEMLGIIQMTRQSGKSKMYRLNKENKTGMFLEKMVLSLAGQQIKQQAPEMLA